MTIEEKMWNLISKLDEMTGKEKLDWKTTQGKRSFQVDFEKFTVRISEEDRPQEGEDYDQIVQDYVISVFDGTGTLVERASDVTIQTSLKTLAPGKAFQTMRKLYDRARRFALGVDEALDSLLTSLKELDDDIPF